MAGDHSLAESELKRLRDGIPALRSLPRLSPELAAWLGRLSAIVEENFGKDSEEMRGLREISPELPSEFYDSIAERLGSLELPEKQANELIAALHGDVPGAAFRRRLHEYDDLMAAMIQSLRSRTQS